MNVIKIIHDLLFAYVITIVAIGFWWLNKSFLFIDNPIKKLKKSKVLYPCLPQYTDLYLYCSTIICSREWLRKVSTNIYRTVIRVTLLECQWRVEVSIDENNIVIRRTRFKSCVALLKLLVFSTLLQQKEKVRNNVKSMVTQYNFNFKTDMYIFI